MIAGNWKMNLTIDESITLVKAIAAATGDLAGIDILVAPPFTNLALVKAAIGNAPILLGGQNMHWETGGAYTGEISGKMLMEAGCSHVILGHSERRTLFGEPSESIDLKVKSAVTAGLIPIVCIGETLEEREGGHTFDTIKTQLEASLKTFIGNRAMPSSTILAYEPVWAIGTGKTATPDQAQEVHHFIREWIGEFFDEDTAPSIRILYGGSVKPDNAGELLSKADIDGALIGGASLKADPFISIIKYQEA